MADGNTDAELQKLIEGYVQQTEQLRWRIYSLLWLIHIVQICYDLFIFDTLLSICMHSAY